MKNILSASIVAFLSTASIAGAANFSPNDIAVYRVGDGSATLSSGATPVFIDEYTTAGTLIQSFALPTVANGGNFALTDSGSAGSDGMLTLSSNGGDLILSGYNAAVGTATVTSSTVARTIGVINFAGAIDTTTTTTAFSGNNIRSATSVDGTGLWAVGGTGGVIFLPDGGSGAGTVVSSSDANNRFIDIAGGQLYSSSSSGTTNKGVSTVGSGTPTTSGQTMTLLPGLASGATGSNNESFAFADLSAAVAGVDTLYIADSVLGIEKYSLVNGNWTANGSITASNIFGLTLKSVGSTVNLYATSSGASGTSGTLYSIADTSGYNGTLSASLNPIATALTNEAFRGVALVPQAVPEPSAFISVFAGIGGLVILGRFRRGLV